MLKIFMTVSLLTASASSFAHEGSHSASHEMMTIMGSMCQSSAKMTMTNDADQDFVAMMIPHHQGAMDMARAYLKEGKDEKIKSMAKKMIESQTKEVADLKNWQGKNSGKVKK